MHIWAFQAREGMGADMAMNNKYEKPYGNKKKTNARERKRNRGVLTFFLAIALIGLLSVTAVGGYMLYDVLSAVNSEDVLFDLRDYISNQSQTTIIYANDKDGNEIEYARLHGEINRIWVDSGQIPENLKNAFIALEDKRFYDHSGVDWVRTIKVIFDTARKADMSQGGGSTITQQLIKNLSDEDSVTFIRKYTEIKRALNVEKKFSKETILETYLNTLYLDHGCYGVETAAEYYFGKEVSELNLAECACLAAITKAPRTYNPLVNFEKNRLRQRECLDYMYEQGYITEEEMQEAKDYELVFTTSENYVAKEKAEDDNDVSENKEEKTYQSYYVDFIIQQVIDGLMLELGISESEAEHKIYYGGLKIYAAVDLDIQEDMDDIYSNRKSFPIEEDTKQNPAAQSAVTVMDYNGRLLGIVGQAGPKTGDRVMNIAANRPRQPGSTIKPLSVYAPAINENLIHWSTKVANYGFMVDGELWPHNYDGSYGSPNQYITVQRAIPPSYNTVPAQILKKYLGLDLSFSYLEENFHLSYLDLKDKAYSPLAIGGMTRGMTTLEMTAAYATFGNGGLYYEPYSYYKVTDRAGSKTILEPKMTGKQAIEEGTADVMRELLKTVTTQSDGTGVAYTVEGFRNKTFCKSGTTTDNNDRWFVGGTPHYVCAVWYGYAEPKKIPASGNPAAKIFKTVMDTIHEGLDTSVDFPDSGQAVKKTYCTGSGLIAKSTCASTGTGWYKADYIPSTCTNCSTFGDAVVPERNTTEPDDGEDDVTVDNETAEPTTRIPITTTEPTVIVETGPGIDRETNPVG